jgi:hypothetical protein
LFEENLTFISNLSPPSSGLKYKATKNPTGACDKLRFGPASYFRWFLSFFNFDPEDRGDIFLRSFMLLFTVTIMRTSDTTQENKSSEVFLEDDFSDCGLG